MNCKITNCYDENHPPKPLPTEKIVLYDPDRPGWTFSHHASIASFKGTLYAIWSNGRQHEDDVGQRVLMSTSNDFYHWTEPAPLVDSRRGKHSDTVLTAAGFHTTGDELIAYFGQYEYAPDNIEDGSYKQIGIHHRDTSLFALTTIDGKHWSDPIDLGVPTVPNHGPEATSSGRLIISGGILFPYTDDPEGLTGWKTNGIYDASRFSEPVIDDAYFRRHIADQRMGWTNRLCEGSFYETDDRMIHMLLRSNTNRLWLTESADDGATWSEPVPTDFSDCRTKFHFGRLPDGRFYYVGCPDPKGGRKPLILSLSEDGIRFDRHYVLGNETFVRKFEGFAKNGHYGYPHTLVHDAYLYCIFSMMKEGIAVIRIKWAELH